MPNGRQYRCWGARRPGEQKRTRWQFSSEARWQLQVTKSGENALAVLRKKVRYGAFSLGVTLQQRDQRWHGGAVDKWHCLYKENSKNFNLEGEGANLTL